VRWGSLSLHARRGSSTTRRFLPHCETHALRQDRYGRYLLRKRATILHASLCGLEAQHLAPVPPAAKAALVPAPPPSAVAAAAAAAATRSPLEQYQAQYSPRTRRMLRKDEEQRGHPR